MSLSSLSPDCKTECVSCRTLMLQLFFLTCLLHAIDDVPFSLIAGSWYRLCWLLLFKGRQEDFYTPILNPFSLTSKLAAVRTGPHTSVYLAAPATLLHHSTLTYQSESCYPHRWRSRFFFWKRLVEKWHHCAWYKATIRKVSSREGGKMLVTFESMMGV